MWSVAGVPGEQAERAVDGLRVHLGVARGAGHGVAALQDRRERGGGVPGPSSTVSARVRNSSALRLIAASARSGLSRK
ncbi:hypothetical protein MTP10_31555 [Nonomuraea sp. 3-1Str]|uniref:hypothetical protein n=1 Tax=Nonomuraea sp. 3-1Str TaxID=2929801 RepID=UPI00285EF7B4|nr:hypothetical protein [Nonomuraea sp. 3-1Str]MDR8413255.1 hypothetical protein [Nonomuraea sp. 3-1Str]